MFGSTESSLGIIKIITVLQDLMHWAETELRAWFEENILFPLNVISRPAMPDKDENDEESEVRMTG